VGVVGLGDGSLAAFSEVGQDWTFFELDEEVKRRAEESKDKRFLRDAKGKVRVILGDGRQLLHERKEKFGLLVLDAFCSDAIPVHLLTTDSVALYRRRLAADGILAFHVSNKYVDLQLVLGNLAAEVKMAACYRKHVPTEKERKLGAAESEWVVMARKKEDLAPILKSGDWQPARTTPGAKVWTDDFSNILEFLRKKVACRCLVSSRPPRAVSPM